jgi:hypothetical protein
LPALFLQPIGLVFLLLFPFLPLINISRKNALVYAPIIVSLNVLAAIINAVFLDALSLPVTPQSIIIVTAIESIAILLLRPKKINFYYRPSDNKYLYFIYFVFLIAIISRVVSVAHLHAPILHDPQAHAFWANMILEDQAINYFYSPGLHIWSMLLSQGAEISIAQSVNYVTNISSAFSVLAWSIATYTITKKSRLALWVAVLVLAAPLPQFLYFIGGKNSFVMSTPFIGISLLFTHYYYLHKSRITFTALLTTLVGIGLIHYPAYAYVAGFAIIFFVLRYALENLSKLTSNTKHHFAQNSLLLLPVIVSLLFIGLVVFTASQQNNYPDIASSPAEAKIYHEQAEASAIVPLYDDVTIETPGSTNTQGINNPLQVAKSSAIDHLSFIKSFPKDIGIMLFAIALVGVYFIFVTKPMTEELLAFQVMLIALILSIALIVVGLGIYPIESLKTTRDTGSLLLPLALSIPVAWLLMHVGKRRLLELIAATIIVLVMSYFTFTVYQEKSTNVFVDEYDVHAFQWIDDNIDESKKFISMTRLDPNRMSVVFPIDGALWIPVFTGNQIATPFQELGFQSTSSHVNYQYVRLLQSEDTNKVTRAISYFLDNDYTYVYVDGDLGYHEFRVQQLIDNNLARIIYNNQEIMIVELIDTGE